MSRRLWSSSIPRSMASATPYQAHSDLTSIGSSTSSSSSTPVSVHQLALQRLPYCIRTFLSTSSWKPGTLLISSLLNTSSHVMLVSLPLRISSCRPGPEPPKTAGLHSPSLAIFNSIPRLIGSAMPNVRLNPSILRASCVSCHFLSRFSRGWALSGREDVWVELVGTTLGPTPARRVSWIPGAEGAPEEYGCRWE